MSTHETHDSGQVPCTAVHFWMISGYGLLHPLSPHYAMPSFRARFYTMIQNGTNWIQPVGEKAFVEISSPVIDNSCIQLQQVE